eukprot:gene4047-5065_t
MKIYTVFILFLLFYFCSDHNLVDSQIVHGPKAELGPVVDHPFRAPATRYDWSWVRLHMRDNTTGYEANVKFHPRVDEFTTLEIPDSFASLMNNSNVNIWVEVPGNKSVVTYITELRNVSKPCKADDGGDLDIPACTNLTSTGEKPTSYEIEEYVTTNLTTYQNITLRPKRVYDWQNDVMINYFTLVIQLDKGRITDAIWDGDRDSTICKDCQFCIDNECAVQVSKMNCILEGGVLSRLCDLKLFVAWAGTDKTNRQCQSINKIPSAFRKYSLTPMAQLGRGLLNDFLYKADQNNPNQA